MTSRFLIALAVTPCLAACAAVPAAPPLDAPPGPAHGVQGVEADLEAIYGIVLSRSGVAAQVNSNGCTKKDDFATQVLDGWPAPTLILKRTRQDMCRALVAGGVELVWSYDELGVKPGGALVLANPLTAHPGPGR